MSFLANTEMMLEAPEPQHANNGLPRQPPTSCQQTTLFILYNLDHILHHAPDRPPRLFFHKLNKHLARFPVQGLLHPSPGLWQTLCLNLHTLKPHLPAFFTKQQSRANTRRPTDPETLIDEPVSGVRHCVLHALSEVLGEVLWRPDGVRSVFGVSGSRRVVGTEKRRQGGEFLQMLGLARQRELCQAICESGERGRKLLKSRVARSFNQQIIQQATAGPVPFQSSDFSGPTQSQGIAESIIPDGQLNGTPTGKIVEQFKSQFRKRLEERYLRFIAYTLEFVSASYPLLAKIALKHQHGIRRSSSCGW